MNILGGRLQGRLSLTYLLLALIVLGAAGVYTARQLKEGVVDALKASLLTQARLMSHLIAPELLQPEKSGRLQLLAHRLGAEIGARVTVIQVDGRVLADSQRTEREVASCLARGEFDCCRADPEAPGKIVELGRALNSLAAQLQQKMRELEQERTRAAGVLEGMAEGVVAVNGEGRLVLANPSARRILGLPPEGLVGRPFRDAVRKEDLWEPLEAALKEGIPVRRELTLSSPSLPSRVLQFHAVPLGEGEASRGAILVLHDITELRRLEGVRQEFVANVSHELRTPLTSIRGYPETLLEGAMEEKENARSFLEIAFRHTERMGRLLDDLLDLSNLEAGRVRLRIEAVSLAEAAEGALSTLGPQGARKGVALRQEVPQGLSPALADRDRLSQITPTPRRSSPGRWTSTSAAPGRS